MFETLGTYAVATYATVVPTTIMTDPSATATSAANTLTTWTRPKDSCNGVSGCTDQIGVRLDVVELVLFTIDECESACKRHRAFKYNVAVAVAAAFDESGGGCFYQQRQKRFISHDLNILAASTSLAVHSGRR